MSVHPHLPATSTNQRHTDDDHNNEFKHDAGHETTDLPNPPRSIKLTGHRLMVSVVTIVLGACKVIASHKGRSVITDTLDWVIGIIVGLLYAENLLQCS
jgi:hypothetical protein